MKSKRLAAALAAAAMVGTAGALAPVTAHAELKPVIKEIKQVEGTTNKFTVSYTGCPKSDMESNLVVIEVPYGTDAKSNPTDSGEGVITFEVPRSGEQRVTLDCGRRSVTSEIFEVKNALLDIQKDASSLQKKGEGTRVRINAASFPEGDVVTIFVTDPAGKRTKLKSVLVDGNHMASTGSVTLPDTYRGRYTFDATAEKSGYTATGLFLIDHPWLPTYDGKPAKPAPDKSAPEKPKPEKPAPEKPKPETPAPGKPAPAKPAPGKKAPGKTVPGMPGSASKAPAKNAGLPSSGV